MDAQVKRDIRLVNIAGTMGSVYFRLAMAEILVLFVTGCLHVPKETWALVAAIASLTAVLHLVSAYVTERLKRRKLLSLTCFAVGRLAVPAIALLPFITGEHDLRFRVFYLAVAMIVRTGLDALGSSAWLSWVADIVPDEDRGRFYSGRLVMTTTANMLVFLVAGWLMDYFGSGNQWAYVVIFGVAFLIGELDLVIHARVSDRPMPRYEKKARLLPMLAAPWRDTGFRSLMTFQMVNMFSVGLLGPFLLMYRVEELGMSNSWIVGVIVIHNVFNVLTYGIWRKVGERVGYRTVYIICRMMIALGIVYYLFLPQGKPAIFLTVMALAQLWHGAAWAGSTLASSTLSMNLAPEKHRSMYFAQVTAVLALTTGLGTFVGRLVYIHANPASDVFLPLIGTKLTGMHVLIGLFALINLFSVRVFGRRIPDAKGDAAMPRIDRILRTNAIRLFPALLPLEQPLAPDERRRHVDSMKELVGGTGRGQVHESLEHVLETPVGTEDELHAIMGRERSRAGEGVRRMLKEIVESAALHLSPVRARVAAKRIQQFYDERDLVGCLRAVRRLARRTAERLDTPKAAAAFNIIEAIVEVQLDRGEPHDDAVLLAVYAYLQMVREPEDRKGQMTGQAGPPTPP